MKTNCAKTCGCGAAPAAPAPSASGECKDKLPAKCKSYGARRCEFTKYKKYMGANCKKTCGKCSGPVATVPSDTSVINTQCKDLKPKFCGQLTKKRCQFPKYKKTMAVNCKATCG